ncbi:hypothetical protein CRYUN_Cryun25bG0060500 [Craigia yunnanensis]
MAYQTSQPIHKGIDAAKFEAWKRRRRAEVDIHPNFSPTQRPMNNGTCVIDPNSLGILGAGPSDKRLVHNDGPYWMR